MLPKRNMLQGFATQHTFNMICYLAVATLASLVLTGAFYQAKPLALLLASAFTGFVGLLGGLSSTVFLRAAFKLMQTGRIIQYACFFLFIWAGLALSALIVSAVFVGSAITGGAWTALLATAIGFAAATIMGEVPTRGRTWLPQRMPPNFRMH